MAEPTLFPRSGFTVFRLPRSHWHCHLFNFEWAGVTPASLQNRVFTFVEDASSGGAPHMLLTGKPGIGKSHLGVGVYRALSVAYGTGMVTWINVPAFCERVKEGYSDSTSPLWDDIEQARRLVVLDDLFGRDLSQHELSQIVYRLIDTAYQNNAAVFVNMNQSHDELQARLAGHEISRLLQGNAEIIPMVAKEDWRRK